MKTTIAFLALVLSGQGASAQSLVAAAPAAGRYAMQPVEGGIARLDTATGEVSLCRIDAGGMTCQPSREDRERLEARIRELSGEAPASEGGIARRGPEPAPATPDTEDDAEFDKALGRMKQVFRAFREITRDFGDDAPALSPDIDPDRT